MGEIKLLNVMTLARSEEHLHGSFLLRLLSPTKNKCGPEMIRHYSEDQHRRRKTLIIKADQPKDRV
jgi:hypothetical protein